MPGGPVGIPRLTFREKSPAAVTGLSNTSSCFFILPCWERGLKLPLKWWFHASVIATWGRYICTFCSELQSGCLVSEGGPALTNYTQFNWIFTTFYSVNPADGLWNILDRYFPFFLFLFHFCPTKYRPFLEETGLLVIITCKALLFLRNEQPLGIPLPPCFFYCNLVNYNYMDYGQNENVSLALSSIYAFYISWISNSSEFFLLKYFVKTAVLQQLGPRLLMMAITFSDQWFMSQFKQYDANWVEKWLAAEPCLCSKCPFCSLGFERPSFEVREANLIDPWPNTEKQNPMNLIIISPYQLS